MRFITFSGLLFAVCFLQSPCLRAQRHPPSSPVGPEQVAELLPDVTVGAPDTASEADEATPAQQTWQRKRVFASANKHPLTPQDVEIRETVRNLGIDRHRFVRCNLRDGSTVVGGITWIGQEQFGVTQGIWGEKHILYSSLRLAPKPDAAPIDISPTDRNGPVSSACAWLLLPW